MKSFLLAALITVAGALPGAAQTTNVTPAPVVVYKSPWCGCCGGWVEHMRDNGFDVTVYDVEDMDPVKVAAQVPEDLYSCHTASIAGYTIEGHVPASAIYQLLAEKPAARGLSVPGMIVGSPGMENGDASEPYQVVLFGDDGTKSVYANY